MRMPRIMKRLKISEHHLITSLVNLFDCYLVKMVEGSQLKVSLSLLCTFHDEACIVLMGLRCLAMDSPALNLSPGKVEGGMSSPGGSFGLEVSVAAATASS